jgi:ATP-dependent RNA helicase SUPV3L1/SUV3
MILTSLPKQISLQDDGRIFWQADASNPLPGVAIATVRKGAEALRPALDLLPDALPTSEDREAVVAHVTAWLHNHIDQVLDVLTKLSAPLPEGATPHPEPVTQIAQAVYAAMGILPRHEVEAPISALDPEMRKTLRAMHIRLGPVLIFIPELNKPAAVRLRALLWWLWHDRPLPAPVPKDGAVSVPVDEAVIDPVFYRAIGYPVYGGRAIRVDMLDRLISAIYDGAKDGIFKAEHKMAEWMGCSIPGLYQILEAMGHQKITEAQDAPPSAAPVPEAAVEVAVEVASEMPADADVPAPAVKPELASFRLRRGKPQGSRPKFEKPRFEKKAGDKPPYKKRDDKKRRPPEKGKRDKPKYDGENKVVFEARPKTVADSPFAILQQMKSGAKE